MKGSKMSPIFCLMFMILDWRVISSTRSSIKLSPGGGYRGIVVQIDDGANEDFCQEIISNVKTMFVSGSSVLSGATGGLVHFGQVTLVVPPTWTEAKCGEPLAIPTGNTPFKAADLLVVGDGGPMGAIPHTKQSGQCGELGDVIILPQQFLIDVNMSKSQWGDSGKLLVREWAKYRYGVFDEFGFSGDLLYPNFFLTSEGRVHPTGTSNAMLTGSWIHWNGSSLCDPTDVDSLCHFRTEGPNRQVTCSLGYLPHIQTVTSWCGAPGGEQPRKEVGPSKQMVLCQGQTVPDVILTSPDFENRRTIWNSVKQEKAPEPLFDVVRQPVSKYVLVIEISSDMARVWKWVRKALQNLIRYEIPDNTQLAIVTFGTEGRVVHQLASLTSERTRARLADTVPDSSNKLSRSRDRCVVCGVKVAMDQVLRNKEPGAHLILLTQGDAATLSSYDQEVLSEYDKYYNVRLSSLLLPKSTKESLDFYHQVAARSGGLSIELDKGMSSGVDILAWLVSSLMQVVSLDMTNTLELPVTVLQQTVGGSLFSEGQFLIDSTLGRDTVWGVFVPDDENHHIKSVQFTNQEGIVFGPYTKMSSIFDIINLKTVNFPIGEKPPFVEKQGQESQSWSYKVEWENIFGQSHPDSIVVVRSKPRLSSQPLRIKTWTNYDKRPSSNEESFQPLIVYVQVNLGNRPVLGADVWMKAEMIDRNLTKHTVGEHFHMIDDGYGDPDLMSGDGIYSRHLTNYTAGPGKYKFTVIITDSSRSAYTVSSGAPIHPQPENLPVPVCCGSNMNVPLSRREIVGNFKRTVSGIVVDINSIGTEDTLPPAKVGDFKVKVNHEDGEQVLMANWTAPGGDFYDGQVEGYHLLYSNSMASILKDGPDEDRELVVITRTDLAGTRISNSFNFQGVSGDYYVGIRAEDANGNLGKVSNLVWVSFISDNKTMEAGLSIPSTANNNTNWAVVGAVLGVILVVLLILTVLLVSFLYRRWSRRDVKNSLHGFTNTRSSGVNVHIPSPAHSVSTDASSCGSEPPDSKLSTHNLVPHMSKPPPSSTSFANNITPTYWSASQLLAGHEHRTYSNHPPSLSNKAINLQNQPLYHQLLQDISQHSHPSDQTYQQYYQVPNQTYGHSHEPEDYQHLDTSGVDYGSDMVDEVLEVNTSKSKSEMTNMSDESSSTLALANPSLQGSLLSLNSGKLGSINSKQRNITQV